MLIQNSGDGEGTKTNRIRPVDESHDEAGRTSGFAFPAWPTCSFWRSLTAEGETGARPLQSSRMPRGSARAWRALPSMDALLCPSAFPEMSGGYHIEPDAPRAENATLDL